MPQPHTQGTPHPVKKTMSAAPATGRFGTANSYSETNTWAFPPLQITLPSWWSPHTHDDNGDPAAPTLPFRSQTWSWSNPRQSWAPLLTLTPDLSPQKWRTQSLAAQCRILSGITWSTLNIIELVPPQYLNETFWSGCKRCNYKMPQQPNVRWD